MKTKIIYLGTVILMIIITIAFNKLEPKKMNFRVHQHRDIISLKEKGNSNSDSEKFTSHLPVIELNTHGQDIPGEKRIKDTSLEDFKKQSSIRATVKMFYKEGHISNISNKPDFISESSIHYRGNSSRHFDKKSLKIRFIDKNNKERSIPLAGMAKESEWVLHGPFLDRTLVRNYLCYNISGEIMEYAPNVRYCELLVNGEYQGVYLIVESIEQGINRINIEKSDKRTGKTPYIVVWDRAFKARKLLDNYFYYTHQSGISGLDIKYPGQDRLTEKQANFIKKDISKIEKTLDSYDLRKYEEYIDRNAFAEYFIINEFFRNSDAGKFSTYYYKDLRSKMKVCVWDFNNACDNYIETDYDEVGFDMLESPIFNMLIKDKKFVELVINKYHKLRKSTLSSDYIISYIDNTVEFLGPAVDRNNQKWGYVFSSNKRDKFNYLVPYERNFTSYNDSVEQLKGFIIKRGEWLDHNIETLYQYCSPSKNANTFLE